MCCSLWAAWGLLWGLGMAGPGPAFCCCCCAGARRGGGGPEPADGEIMMWNLRCWIIACSLFLFFVYEVCVCVGGGGVGPEPPWGSAGDRRGRRQIGPRLGRREPGPAGCFGWGALTRCLVAISCSSATVELR